MKVEGKAMTTWRSDPGCDDDRRDAADRHRARLEAAALAIATAFGAVVAWGLVRMVLYVSG